MALSFWQVSTVPETRATEWREVASGGQRIGRTYPRSGVQYGAARIDLVTLDQEVGGPPLPHGANQCVGIARDHVRHDIFELAQLVAAVSETGVAVLPLGENFRRQAEQFFDRGRSEGQFITLKFR